MRWCVIIHARDDNNQGEVVHEYSNLCSVVYYYERGSVQCGWWSTAYRYLTNDTKGGWGLGFGGKGRVTWYIQTASWQLSCKGLANS